MEVLWGSVKYMHIHSWIDWPEKRSWKWCSTSHRFDSTRGMYREAFGFPCELLYPSPWKINVLSNGLVNRGKIVKTVVADTAHKILTYPTRRECCLTLPIAWGICTGVCLRGVAPRDATISAKAHLSGERRTASVIGKQESSWRGEVDDVSCGVTLSELRSFERMARPSHCVGADRELWDKN